MLHEGVGSGDDDDVFGSALRSENTLQLSIKNVRIVISS